MIESTEAGALRWLSLVIPFKAPSDSLHDCLFGYSAFLRLFILLCLCIHTTCYLIHHRASPKSSLWRVSFKAHLISLLFTAAVTEADQQDVGLAAYRYLLAKNLLIFHCLCVGFNLLATLFVSVPAPTLVWLTPFWWLHHIKQGSCEQALLEAHRKYGPVVRISLYEYSIAKADFDYSALCQFAPVNHPEETLQQLQIFKDLFSTETKQVELMSKALKHEPVIDTCIDHLVAKLAEFIDHEDGVQVSKLLTCFCWDIMGAATVGDRFGFLESSDAAKIVGNIAGFKTLSILNGSFFRFMPWIRKLMPSDRSDQLLKDWMRFFDTVMLQKCVTGNGEEAGIKTLRDQVGNRSELLESIFESHQPHSYLHGVLCLLIGAADPIAMHLQTTLAYLALQPGAQDRIKVEFQSSGKKGPLAIGNLLDLNSSLPFLDSVLQESNRLMGAGALACSYHSNEPLVIDNYRIPPESTVRFTKMAAGRDKTIFGDDADEWKPSRWLEKEKIPAGISFGSSTVPYHNTTSKAIVAKVILRLLHRFKFTASPKMSGFTMMPEFAGKCVIMSTEDLANLTICIKDYPSLKAKFAGLEDGGSVAIMTRHSEQIHEVVRHFNHQEKEQLIRYFTNSDELKSFNVIKSDPIDRSKRHQVHSLIRSLSKGMLASATDGENRISIFKKGSDLDQYHRQNKMDKNKSTSTKPALNLSTVKSQATKPAAPTVMGREVEAKTIFQPDIKPVAQPDTKSVAQPDNKPVAQPDNKSVTEANKAAAKPSNERFNNSSGTPYNTAFNKQSNKYSNKGSNRPSNNQHIKPARKSEIKPVEREKAAPVTTDQEVNGSTIKMTFVQTKPAVQTKSVEPNVQSAGQSTEVKEAGVVTSREIDGFEGTRIKETFIQTNRSNQAVAQPEKEPAKQGVPPHRLLDTATRAYMAAPHRRYKADAQ